MSQCFGSKAETGVKRGVGVPEASRATSPRIHYLHQKTVRANKISSTLNTWLQGLYCVELDAALLLASIEVMNSAKVCRKSIDRI